MKSFFYVYLRELREGFHPGLLIAGLLLFPFALSMASCKGGTMEVQVVLVGSTPGDEPVKAMLAIPATTPVDFIRWKLELSNGKQPAFTLELIYGESQPNTLGFKGGGERKRYQGTYELEADRPPLGGAVYQLRGAGLPEGLALLKLNDNLFHLLTTGGRLMVGNGGWSYTLNRETPLPESADELPAFKTASGPQKEATAEMVFVGRTPCQELAAEHPEWQVSQACFKKKWKVTLYRDPQTGQPTRYEMRRVLDNQPADIQGSWAIVRGTAARPDALIYQLDPDEQGSSLSFLVGDENVLFLLDTSYRLFTGNADFSFTLNRSGAD